MSLRPPRLECHSRPPVSEASSDGSEGNGDNGDSEGSGDEPVAIRPAATDWSGCAGAGGDGGNSTPAATTGASEADGASADVCPSADVCACTDADADASWTVSCDEVVGWGAEVDSTADAVEPNSDAPGTVPDASPTSEGFPVPLFDIVCVVGASFTASATGPSSAPVAWTCSIVTGGVATSRSGLPPPVVGTTGCATPGPSRDSDSTSLIAVLMERSVAPSPSDGDSGSPSTTSPSATGTGFSPSVCAASASANASDSEGGLPSASGTPKAEGFRPLPSIRPLRCRIQSCSATVYRLSLEVQRLEQQLV